MKKGDVRKLPYSNSPMWTDQWAVQGGAKSPYIVSHKKDYSHGGTTALDWACSCPDFTKHMPRTECKHILKVMLSGGVKPVAPSVAALSADQQEAFRKFMAQQVAAGKKIEVEQSVSTIKKGRKFR